MIGRQVLSSLLVTTDDGESDKKKMPTKLIFKIIFLVKSFPRLSIGSWHWLTLSTLEPFGPDTSIGGSLLLWS